MGQAIERLRRLIMPGAADLRRAILESHDELRGQIERLESRLGPADLPFRGPGLTGSFCELTKRVEALEREAEAEFHDCDCDGGHDVDCASMSGPKLTPQNKPTPRHPLSPEQVAQSQAKPDLENIARDLLRRIEDRQCASGKPHERECIAMIEAELRAVWAGK